VGRSAGARCQRIARRPCRRVRADVAGDEGGAAALVELYGKANTPALRDAVLQGLLVADDAEAVKKLYRNARTTEEKKALLRVLTSMDDDSAMDVIEQELGEPENKR